MAAVSVGVVGLGTMGGPIAKRLERQGLSPNVVDPNPQTLQYYVVEGGSGALATPLDLARMSEIVLLVLSDETALREAVNGPNGIAHGLKPGSLVVDFGGGAPDTGAALGRALASRGAQWIEAVPVGSPKDAAAGTLELLVGGRAEAVDRARPVLEALSRRIVHTGPVGSGALAKSLGAVLAGLNLAAAAEVLIIGKRFGLEPEAALEAFAALGPAAGALPPVLAEEVFSGRFRSGTTLTRLLADIDRARDAASARNTPAPLTALLREMCAAAKLDAETSDDHTELVRWLERVARAELRGASGSEA